MSPGMRWFTAMVPALALAFVYAGLLRPTYREQIATAAKQLAAEEQKLRLPVPRQAADIGSRMTAAEERRDEIAKRRAALLARWSRGSSRAESVKQVSRSLADGGVLVERSAAETSDSRESRSTPGARLLAQRMAELGGDPPTSWRVDFHCSWSQLNATFERFAVGNVFSLPIGIHLAPVPGVTDSFEVALWLWI